VLQILGNQRTIIKNFISNSNTVVRELDVKKHQLQNWIVQASRASDVSASRRAAIAAGFQRLPTFLAELDGTMKRLSDLTDAQTPVLQNLHQAAPALNTLFTRLGPFSEASRPAFRSLGRASVAGKTAFTDSKQEIVALRQLAQGAPEAAKPLRQLLQTLDDRNRSTENSTLAQATAPPNPDPTAMSKAKRFKGFTGMEAIFNYVYWQVLSLNQYDSVSHFLRAIIIRDDQCGKFQNDLRSTALERQIRDRCSNYLGPNQPGITSPDTPPDSVAAGQTTPKRATKPKPGQTDWSRPHPSLPASQQQLLQHYGAPTQLPAPAPTPSLPSPGLGSSTAHVLDYLLGP
jgi:ABC-type transporter Mla subunit MlaD